MIIVPNLLTAHRIEVLKSLGVFIPVNG